MNLQHGMMMTYILAKQVDSSGNHGGHTDKGNNFPIFVQVAFDPGLF